MRRASLVRLFVAIFVLQGAWAVYTQNSKVPGPLRIEKVKGELYMISGEGGNVAVYVTGEGVVLVDDMFDRNHADILAQVKSVTDKPLKYVLNTHQHDDHAGGVDRCGGCRDIGAHLGDARPFNQNIGPLKLADGGIQRQDASAPEK